MGFKSGLLAAYCVRLTSSFCRYVEIEDAQCGPQLYSSSTNVAETPRKSYLKVKYEIVCYHTILVLIKAFDSNHQRSASTHRQAAPHRNRLYRRSEGFGALMCFLVCGCVDVDCSDYR